MGSFGDGWTDIWTDIQAYSRIRILHLGCDFVRPVFERHPSEDLDFRGFRGLRF